MTRLTHHANLITGGSRQERENKAKTLAKDLLGREHLVSSLDFTEIVPAEGSSTVGIDKIRELKLIAQLKPREGKRKVVLIPDAQRLTIETQNALLKILEEPPKDTIFILSSPHENNLLPTITSRCVKLKIAPKLDLGEDHNNNKQSAITFIQLLTSNHGKRLDWVNSNLELIKDSEKIIIILSVWQSVLRDTLLIKSSVSENLINYELISNIRELAQRLTQKECLKAVEKVQKIKALIENTNVDKRLCLEVLLIDLPLQ